CPPRRLANRETARWCFPCLKLSVASPPDAQSRDAATMRSDLDGTTTRATTMVAECDVTLGNHRDALRMESAMPRRLAQEASGGFQRTTRISWSRFLTNPQ